MFNKNIFKKSTDGTVKCRQCETDFCVLHNGDVQCSNCGQSVGVIDFKKDTQAPDAADPFLSAKDVIEEQIQTNNDLLFALEAAFGNTMRSKSNEDVIRLIKANITKLKDALAA